LSRSRHDRRRGRARCRRACRRGNHGWRDRRRGCRRRKRSYRPSRRGSRRRSRRGSRSRSQSRRKWRRCWGRCRCRGRCRRCRGCVRDRRIVPAQVQDDMNGADTLIAVNAERTAHSESVSSIVRTRLPFSVIDSRRVGRSARCGKAEVSRPGRLRDGRIQNDRLGVGRNPALPYDGESSVRVSSECRPAIGTCGISGIEDPAGAYGVKAFLRRLTCACRDSRHPDQEKRDGEESRFIDLRPTPAAGTLRRSSIVIAQIDIDQSRTVQGADRRADST
jgi:hypothetical protein